MDLSREAMYGTSGDHVEKDLRSYCACYATIIPFRRDEKTGKFIRTTGKEIMDRAAGILGKLGMIIVIYSILTPFQFAPFPSPRTNGTFVSQLCALFHWGHILNNFCIAGITSLAIDYGNNAIGLGITCLTGFSTIEIMHSPMCLSKSPSDFWGRRWNLTMHKSIKNGVYRPLRKFLPRHFAAVGAFLASGLLHEYVLSVIALKAQLYPWIGLGYIPRHGSQLLFFLWNGAMVAMEYVLCDTFAIKWATNNLPRPIITCLVVLTVLPVSHLFTDEYLRSGFYSDISLGWPIIVKLPD
mmetsp:Transcript_8545/g.19794  ORF Transcript_8545/g.19794 Transcript_8545/m.19794 type:complete len:297 (+) Transcript_8545:40-930(+)